MIRKWIIENKGSVYFLGFLFLAIFIWNNGFESYLNATSRTVTNEHLDYEFETSYAWQAQNYNVTSQSNNLATRLTRIFNPPEEIEIYYREKLNSNSPDYIEFESWMGDILGRKQGVWENELNEYDVNGLVGFRRSFDTPKFRGIMIFISVESEEFMFLLKFNSRVEIEATEIFYKLIQSFSELNIEN